MKKNILLIIVFTCVSVFNAFCSNVDFIKIENASYFVGEPGNLNNLLILYGSQRVEINIDTLFYPATRRNEHSGRPTYVSSNDIYAKILEKISPDNQNKDIEITASGMGETIKILYGFYYSTRYLYNKNLFLVKTKNVENKNNE